MPMEMAWPSLPPASAKVIRLWPLSVLECVSSHSLSGLHLLLSLLLSTSLLAPTTTTLPPLKLRPYRILALVSRR